MKKFRLKKEAVQFFKEKHATAIYNYDTWQGLGVDDAALEEVEDCHIIYGHENDRGNYKSSSLSGWDEKGARFHFTICFPSMKHFEYDKFSKGKITRKLMDNIQRNIDYFYSEFINENLPDK